MVFMHSSLVTVVSFILLRSPEMVLEGKKQMQEARLKTMYIDMIQKIKKKKKKQQLTLVSLIITRPDSTIPFWEHFGNKTLKRAHKLNAII